MTSKFYKENKEFKPNISLEKMKAQFAMQNRETTPTPALVLKINWPPVVLSNSEEVTEPSNSVGEISLNIASGNDKEIVQLPTDIDKDVDNEIY